MEMAGTAQTRCWHHRVSVVIGVDIVKKIASMVTSLLILMGTPASRAPAPRWNTGTGAREPHPDPGGDAPAGGARPAAPLEAAALGAAVGSQFGGGSGQTVATTVGPWRRPRPPVAARATSRVQGKADGRAVDQDRGGKTAQRLKQDQDPALTFNKRDKVRILTTERIPGSTSLQ